MASKFLKGSEWRKWDLHIHSLNTHLNNNYKGVTVDSFVKRVIDKDIEAVGLTNYFNFSKEDFGLKKKLEEKGVTVFLNLEIRLSYQNKEDDCCDAHIVFDSSVAEKEIDSFLTKLNVSDGATEKIAKNLSTTEEFNKAVVEFDHLIETLNQESLGLVGRYLIGFLSRGKGASRSSTNYEKIAKKSHFLIHSSDKVENIEEDRSFWLRENKPLLQSSDAHEIDDIGSKFTWIKADPTFEGLRQIIFEPQERVAIQELKPQEKELYRIIDKVQLKDKNFTKEAIYLNQNLNSIIGSRSSGKTTLINSIAKAIDPEQFSEANRHVKNPAFKEPPIAEVFWCDGSVSTIEDSSGKGITYIPQNYINNLAEAEGQDAPIISIAENALFGGEDTTLNEKRGTLKKEIQNIHIDISTSVAKLFVLRKQLDDQEGKIKQLGDKEGIKKEISKLEKDIQKLQTNLSAQEQKTLKKLRKQFSGNQIKLEEVRSDIKEIKAILSDEDDLSSMLFVEKEYSFQQHELQQDFTNFHEEQEKRYAEQFIEFLNTKLREQVKRFKELQSANKKILENNKELIAKAKENKAASEKQKDKETQEKKLADIIKEENSLSEYQKEINDALDHIIGMHEKRTQIRKEFVKDTKGEIDDIRYAAKLRINHKSLSKFFKNNINLFSSLEAKKIIYDIKGFRDKDGNEDYSVLLDSQNLKTVLSLLLEGDSNEQLKVKANVELQTAVDGLVSDYEFISYSLTYEGDEYVDMTPGKKALVVLKLLVEASNDEYPILIDQPEDDLDSRSISNEVVEFLKTKKKQRQIILVTHNANIAIKADAEEIIVANRHSSTYKNKNGLGFDYVSGSIENTFKNDGASYFLGTMGIREHSCELLEGGEKAFEKREQKYGFKKII